MDADGVFNPFERDEMLLASANDATFETEHDNKAIQAVPTMEPHNNFNVLLSMATGGSSSKATKLTASAAKP